MEGDALTIQFCSDNFDRRRGFHARYTIIDCKYNIFSVRSKISLTGVLTPEFRPETFYLTRFLPKTDENVRNWTKKRSAHPYHRLRSANDIYKTKH